MKFTITCKQAELWARETIEYFNNTCRLGERARRLVKVVADESTVDTVKNHDWYKTNLVGDEHGRDFYRCTVCGITGSRWALDGDTVPDRKFKATVYERCDTSPGPSTQAG